MVVQLQSMPIIELKLIIFHYAIIFTITVQSKACEGFASQMIVSLAVGQRYVKGDLSHLSSLVKKRSSRIASAAVNISANFCSHKQSIELTSGAWSHPCPNYSFLKRGLLLICFESAGGLCMLSHARFPKTAAIG